MTFFLSLGARLVFVAVGRVVIRRVGLELGGAGIHEAVGRDDARRFALRADLRLGHAADRGKLAVGKAELLRAQNRDVVRVFLRSEIS